MFNNPVVLQVIQNIMAVVAAIATGQIALDFSTPWLAIGTIAAILFVLSGAKQGQLIRRASLTQYGELDIETDKLRSMSAQRRGSTTSNVPFH